MLLVALGSSLPLTAERRLDDAPPAPRDPPTSGLHAAFFLLRKAVSLAFQSRPAARLRFMGPELLTDRLFHALSLALRAAGPGLRLRAAATRWGRAAEQRPRGGGEEARGRLPVFVTLTQGAGSLVPGNSPGTVASAHVCSYALEERSWTLRGVRAGGGRECVYPPHPCGVCPTVPRPPCSLPQRRARLEKRWHPVALAPRRAPAGARGSLEGLGLASRLPPRLGRVLRGAGGLRVPSLGGGRLPGRPRPSSGSHMSPGPETHAAPRPFMETAPLRGCGSDTPFSGHICSPSGSFRAAATTGKFRGSRLFGTCKILVLLR